MCKKKRKEPAIFFVNETQTLQLFFMVVNCNIKL